MSVKGSACRRAGTRANRRPACRPPACRSPNTSSCLTPPPVAATRHSGSAARPSNRITPSGLQLPSAPYGASQIVCGGPPAISTFFSLPPAMNPRKRLSGDQNGRMTPSVPASGRASSESSGRIQIRRLPSPSAANAMCRPLGDTTGGLAFCAFGGEISGNRTTGAGSGARRIQATAKPDGRQRRHRAGRPREAFARAASAR